MVAVVVEVVVVAVEAIVVALVVVLVVVVRGSGTIYSCCVKVHQQRRCKNRRPLGPLVKIIYVAIDANSRPLYISKDDAETVAHWGHL